MMAQCLPLQRCSSLASPLEFLLEDLELISGRDSKQKFRVDDAIPSRKTQCSSQLQGVTPATEDLIFFFSPFQQTRQHSLTGSLVQHCYCQFDFCSFSPVPAEALRMCKANEPLTCPAAPALPSRPEHADRLQQL